MMSGNAYVMEHPQEAHRLEGKTDPARDRRQLELVGIRPGMAVLDAAGGTGAVARTIAELVGPDGRVTVLDRSEERLRFGKARALESGLTNISFSRHDLMAEPSLKDEFDLVWCRFAFEYLSDPVAALRNLTRYVRIGGKIVVGDLDGNGVTQYPTNPVVQHGIELVLRCVEGLFDPFVGRKLVSYFHAADLHVDAVHVQPYHVYAGHVDDGDLDNWKSKLAQLRARCAPSFACESDYDRFAAEFIRHLATPGVFTYSTLILVEGTRVV